MSGSRPRTHDRPDLLTRLEHVRRDLDAVRDRGAAGAAEHAARSLPVDLLARRAELTDPGRPARAAAGLDRARARWRPVQAAGQEWPQVLGKGFAALNSDLGFEVRNPGAGGAGRRRGERRRGRPVRHREKLQAWLRDRMVFETRRRGA